MTKGHYSMRVLKISVVGVALTVALSASVFAQTAPPAGAPKPQTPPATPPAAQTPPAAPKAPPMPFPQDAKIAFIDVNMIAGTSAAGKDASKKLTDFTTKKSAEIADKNKQLQALTAKRDTGGAVLNDAARATLDKDIDKLQRDIQFAQSNAQAELQDLQNELQGEFQKRLIPVIEEVAKEKGLHAVFSIADSGAAYVHPGLNISDEVVKRLDAAAAKK
jgi:Skp family chaperone for outer membrane proteins